MASRGVNGASESTLNDRFIKCEGCNVNIPKEDMIKAGNCTVCRRAPSNIRQLNMVEFTEATPKKISKRKRWTVLISKKGREYYYNTETGEECWEKPADFEAFASEEDQFVPFRNDAVKNAVLMEQAKNEANKLGIPVQLIDTEIQTADANKDKFEKLDTTESADSSAVQCEDQSDHNEASRHTNHKEKDRSSCSTM